MPDNSLIVREAIDCADFLGMLSSPTRLKMLVLLQDGEIAVGELARRVGISQSALSQHLALLRDRNLVDVRRDAQTKFCSCTSTKVARILDVLSDIIATDAPAAGINPATKRFASN